MATRSRRPRMTGVMPGVGSATSYPAASSEDHLPVYAGWAAAVHQRIAPIIVFGVYLVAMLIAPVFADVSISDDWTYARSVEYLVEDGQFHILPVAAATQLFQLLWGAGFALVFGMSFGALRLSTVVLVGLSGLAFYGTLRTLKVDRERSALGTAIYLFNPILFSIAYSFMSDPHFLALMVIATYGYVRGEVAESPGWQLAASVVVAAACLQRPHGALVPLGVATYLLIARRLPISRASVRDLVRIGGIPAATTAIFYLIVSAGLPSQQDLFLSEVRSATVAETLLLIRRLTVMESAYIGLFVLPLLVAGAGAAMRSMSFAERRSWLLFTGAAAVVAGGIGWFWGQGRIMPYIPHFLGRGGPGSGDLRSSRPPLFEPAVYSWLTLLCAASAIGLAALAIRAMERRDMPARNGAGVVTGILAWQVAGVLPQSFLFRNWIVSLDRYLLPLLPLVVILGVWALQRETLNRTAMWTAVAALGFFSIVGTRDVLVFQESVWSIASSLNRQGVANTRLDAGYAWDAYHLWEYGDENEIPRQTPDGAWWTDAYATATDSSYVLAGKPLPGYDVISIHPYSAWLHEDPMYLYVLRRSGLPLDGVIWPPPPVSDP